MSEEVKITKSGAVSHGYFPPIVGPVEKIRLSSQPAVIKRDKDPEAAKQ